MLVAREFARNLNGFAAITRVTPDRLGGRTVRLVRVVRVPGHCLLHWLPAVTHTDNPHSKHARTARTARTSAPMQVFLSNRCADHTRTSARTTRPKRRT